MRRKCTGCYYEHTGIIIHKTLTDLEIGIKVSGSFTSDETFSMKGPVLYDGGICDFFIEKIYFQIMVVSEEFYRASLYGKGKPPIFTTIATSNESNQYLLEASVNSFRSM